jgi:hypothetical protein
VPPDFPALQVVTPRLVHSLQRKAAKQQSTSLLPAEMASVVLALDHLNLLLPTLVGCRPALVVVQASMVKVAGVRVGVMQALPWMAVVQTA